MQRQLQQNQRNDNQQQQKATIYTIDTMNMAEIIEKSLTASTEQISVKGTINVIKMNRTAFDLGSTKSIILAKIARNHNLKINKCGTQVLAYCGVATACANAQAEILRSNFEMSLFLFFLSGKN